jgi:hypothetical protein
LSWNQLRSKLLGERYRLLYISNLVRADPTDLPSRQKFHPPGKNRMNVLILKYRSGEEIRKGDRVLFHGNPAEVELVARDPNDPEAAWHMQEFGGGVMILDPMASARTFIPTDQINEYEDLEFVSRT